MTIFALGSVNTAALTVPGAYVAIVPPQIQYINGVPTGVQGVVGTASWGPVDAPTPFGGYSEYAGLFGPLLNRRYDMGTAVAIATQQGASSFQGVRVTDGTDTAALVSIGNGQVQSVYNLVPGSGYSAGYGNTISAVIAGAGATAPVFRLTVSGGVITACAVVSGGSNLTACALTVKGGSLGSGAGAILTATVAGGVVTSVAVSGTMTGYQPGPTFTVSSTSGSGIIIQAPVAGGVLSPLTVPVGGSGYAQNPSLAIADSAGTGASGSLSIGAAQATAKYTGSAGNYVAPSGSSPGAGITLQFAGSNIIVAGSTVWKCIISAPNLMSVPEVIDGIVQPSGQAFWPIMVTAVNGGTSYSGPSQHIVMSQAGQNGGPTVGMPYTMAGGTDGASGVGTSLLLGVDGTTRTGMYALRGTGCSVGLLVDCADSTAWSTEVAFALSESLYMVDSGPIGDTLTNAPTVKSTAGIDTYAIKILFGDWVYWRDTVNGVIRLVSPASFSAGLLANLSPEQSSLNKQVQAVVGTQKSATNTVYSQADLAQLAAAGIDVIANPAPGGAYFAPVIGRNASSNANIHGDNYTRLTNFIAVTINTWMGQVVGLLQNPTTRRQAFVLLDSFFFNLWQQGIIGNADGTQPYGITLNDSNNPPSRVALGYMQANVQVQYQSVIEYMLAEIEGGQSVQISRQAVAPALSN